MTQTEMSHVDSGYTDAAKGLCFLNVSSILAVNCKIKSYYFRYKYRDLVVSRGILGVYISLGVSISKFKSKLCRSPTV